MSYNKHNSGSFFTDGFMPILSPKTQIRQEILPGDFRLDEGGEIRRFAGLRPPRSFLSGAADGVSRAEIHSSWEMRNLSRAVLHTESGVDLIPAHNRLSDAAARLQVMRMSQYEAVKETARPCEKILDGVVTQLKDSMYQSRRFVRTSATA